MRRIGRREFLATSAAATAALTLTGSLRAADGYSKLSKALIGAPDEATMRAWKEAGFDGFESNRWDVTPEEAEKTRKLAESCGLKIHSVLRGWTNFNKADVVDRDVAGVETALRATQAYGGNALLLVPCRIGGMAMPEAWEFQIEFDPANGHLTRVAAGDNARYADYIAAHNEATDASRKAVERLIPVAEKTGVVIALENVWNNLWVKPDLFANFVGSFKSPWVQAYFDIGNHVKYAPSQEWIAALGKLIVCCHVKDFKLNPDGHGGQFVNIRDGSVDWPTVRKALADIGYADWMTIEGGDLSLAEHSQRLDEIIAGR